MEEIILVLLVLNILVGAVVVLRAGRGTTSHVVLKPRMYAYTTTTVSGCGHERADTEPVVVYDSSWTPVPDSDEGSN